MNYTFLVLETKWTVSKQIAVITAVGGVEKFLDCTGYKKSNNGFGELGGKIT